MNVHDHDHDLGIMVCTDLSAARSDPMRWTDDVAWYANVMGDPDETWPMSSCDNLDVVGGAS